MLHNLSGSHRMVHQWQYKYKVIQSKYKKEMHNKFNSLKQV